MVIVFFFQLIVGLIIYGIQGSTYPHNLENYIIFDPIKFQMVPNWPSQGKNLGAVDYAVIVHQRGGKQLYYFTRSIFAGCPSLSNRADFGRYRFRRASIPQRRIDLSKFPLNQFNKRFSSFSLICLECHPSPTNKVRPVGLWVSRKNTF